MKNERVCIVGAGISGLRCAAILLQHGVKVTILEARERIGGRASLTCDTIAQNNDLGWPIDIGANWVHSTTGNPIMDLATETNTPIHSWTPTTILIDSMGKITEENLANKTLDTVWRILEEAAEYSNKNYQQIDASESLYDFFEYKCSGKHTNSLITEYQRELILGMAQMWGAYVGDAVNCQSLKYFFLEECVDSEDQFIATTYYQILQRVSKPVLSSADVHFRKDVIAIKSIKEHISVLTGDGVEYEFEDIVITCPLGWLKRNINSISPITPRLTKAIENISYGRLEKVFLVFPAPYWDHGRSQPVSFFHWNTPSSDIKKRGSYRIEAVSLAALPPPHNKAALLFYTFGDCSSYLNSLIRGVSGNARFEAITEFLKPYYSRLPHYNSATCIPVAALATEWSQDKFAGFGSYSNFQIGMTEANLDVDCIRQGMPEHHIWFAGEHTAPFDGLGTVSGAYLSGERIAERIVQSRSR